MENINKKHFYIASLATLFSALLLTGTIFFNFIKNPVPTYASSSPTLNSTATDGTQGNNNSDHIPSISADGRFVTFQSDATNLVPNDTNSRQDIFLHDNQTGTTKRISISSNGGQANSHSMYPNISADGRYTTFSSNASNLVSEDTNGHGDIFVYDNQTGTTERVSVASDGTEGDHDSFNSAIDPNGRFVTFSSRASNLAPNDTNNDIDVFVHDRQTGETERIEARKNAILTPPSITSDGRYVFFDTSASLIPEDTNSSIDIYIYDRQLDILERLNPTYNSTQVNNQTEDQFITPDGRYIVFESIASNIISNDTNGQWDIFLYDRQTDTSQRVSIASDGTQGNGGSRHPSISEDGRYVTFSSNASNLVDNDTNSYTDVFIHDNQTGETTRISVASDGTQGNEKSGITHISTPSGPIISEDGKYIAFDSSASNLVSQDINGKNDIFLTINPQYPVNTPPILNPIGNKTIGEGQLLEFTVTATDPDGDDLTFSAANLPSGANFDPQTATFSWTPGYDQEGNYEDVEFTVTDDGTPIELDTELITITVGNINRAPEFDPIGPQEVLEDENLTFTVSATDPDGDNFTLSAQGLPTGATFDDQTGIFSWTPTLSQEGIYVVTFNATDNGTPVEVGSIDVDITVGDNPTPVEQAENLVEEVINYEFPTNVENSYLANLKKVAKFIEDGKIQPAINQLNAFIDKVEEDYLAGIITQEERDNLVGLAEALLADLQ